MATPHPTAEPANAPPQVLRLPETETIDKHAIARHFGGRLRHERRLADLSQEDLCFLAGLDRTEVSRLERGQRLPRIDTLIKLAGGLECAPDLLLSGLTWRPGSTRAGRFVEGRQA